MESVLLPINDLTKYLYYTHPVSNQNQRMVVSALTEKPIVWKISKVVTHSPVGVIKINLSQDSWNDHTDYVNLETGEMYADYYSSSTEPTDPDIPSPTPSAIYGKITASTSTIKVGGSYKTLTLKLYDADDNEVTDNYSSATFVWDCYIKGDETEVSCNKAIWSDGGLFNQKKIKFTDDRSYLDKILVVHCRIFDEHEGYINVSSEFELIV